jgi:hypothetical protein
MKLIDLIEGTREHMRQDWYRTMPNTLTIAGAENSDAYSQYRYTVGLAAALSIKNGDSNSMEPWGPYGEDQTVVCYSPAEQEIIDLTDRIFGYKAKEVTSKKSEEPKFVNKKSPVRKFEDLY